MTEFNAELGFTEGNFPCTCEHDVYPEDLRAESRSLVHVACGGIYDPAAALREKRQHPGTPHRTDLEDRVFDINLI